MQRVSAAAEEGESAAWLAGRLELAGIVANKNSLPGDPKPWLPSGIRMGTPAMTTLGMKEAEARQVADFITRATRAARDDAKLAAIKEEVKNFMTPFTTRI